ncbi:MAG: DUF4862 family protein [Acidobacteria bacterium]|nr:DUF4862 family protein [Acidobacteriota bacterium]
MHQQTAEAAPVRQLEWFIGAYAALPSGEWDRPSEQRLLASYSAAPEFRGWEVPFSAELHAHDPEWFLKQLGDEAQLVITMIPVFMNRLQQDPMLGLASNDDGGRQRAVALVAEARNSVARVSEALGRKVVRAVELHSAPPAGNGSSASHLRKSLQEIAGWDWCGAELLLEHCDAAVPGVPGSKEFLPISEEIEVLTQLRSQLPTQLGMVINWGRSAIEGRSAQTAVDHIAAAKAAGVLRGVMFSGCSDQDGAWGPAWSDVHLPPALVAGPSETSLLTLEAINAAIQAIGNPAELSVFGLKISPPPGSSLAESEAVLGQSSAAILGSARQA